MDHLADIRDWDEEAELQKLGNAYAQAAAEVLGLERAAESYSQEQFVREVQAATGSTVDGVAGVQTLGNTVTVSAERNSTHPVVKPIQKRLAALGYTQVGPADGIAGPLFRLAVMAFQRDHNCWVDGEITKGNKTWRKLLGME